MRQLEEGRQVARLRLLEHVDDVRHLWTLELLVDAWVGAGVGLELGLGVGVGLGLGLTLLGHMVPERSIVRELQNWT